MYSLLILVLCFINLRDLKKTLIKPINFTSFFILLNVKRKILCVNVAYVHQHTNDNECTCFRECEVGIHVIQISAYSIPSPIHNFVLEMWVVFTSLKLAVCLFTGGIVEPPMFSIFADIAWILF